MRLPSEMSQHDVAALKKQSVLLARPDEGKRITAFLQSSEFARHLRWLVEQTREHGVEFHAYHVEGSFIHSRFEPALGREPETVEEGPEESKLDYNLRSIPLFLKAGMEMHPVRAMPMADDLDMTTACYSTFASLNRFLAGIVAVDGERPEVHFNFYVPPYIPGADKNKIGRARTFINSYDDERKQHMPELTDHKAVSEFLECLGINSAGFSVDISKIRKPGWKLDNKQATKIYQAMCEGAGNALTVAMQHSKGK